MAPPARESGNCLHPNSVARKRTCAHPPSHVGAMAQERPGPFRAPNCIVVRCPLRWFVMRAVSTSAARRLLCTARHGPLPEVRRRCQHVGCSACPGSCCDAVLAMLPWLWSNLWSDRCSPSRHTDRAAVNTGICSVTVQAQPHAPYMRLTRHTQAPERPRSVGVGWRGRHVDSKPKRCNDLSGAFKPPGLMAGDAHALAIQRHLQQ